MISANRLKYYSSLLQKKYREEENKFIAEGLKVVEEGLNSSYKCEIIFIRNDFQDIEKSLQYITNKGIELVTLSEKEFSRISDSKSPQGISAVFIKPALGSPAHIKTSVAACLDKISDPGNIGTILRNCDWFGISDIIIGEDNADIFNPKTIRSSMGSIFHMNLFLSSELKESLLSLKKKEFKIITADLKGTDLFGFHFPAKCIFVFSSEAHGVSLTIKEVSDEMIAIPGFGKAESLNVASASAIILSRYAEKKI